MGITFLSLFALTFVFHSAYAFTNDKPYRGRGNYNHNTSGFNPDKQLSRTACGGKLGMPKVDVQQKVKNDVDSGFGDNAYFPGQANYWNVESYTRYIKVWSLTPTTWCASVFYSGGHFDAFYKQTGPAGTGLIGSSVNGEMHGGYRATFTGVFAPTGAWPTRGNVGTFDYNCDLHGTCTHVDWVAQYFPGYTNFAQPWWGWIYNAKSHGTWINSSDGSSGNIL